STANQYLASLWVALNCAKLTASSDTITVTYSAADTSAKNGAAMGCAGVANATAVDVTPTPTGNAGSASPSITSGTLVQATEVVSASETNATGGGAISWGGSPAATIAGFQTAGQEFSSMAGFSVSSTASTAYGGTITSAKWAALLVSLTPVAIERQY